MTTVNFDYDTVQCNAGDFENSFVSFLSLDETRD